MGKHAKHAKKGWVETADPSTVVEQVRGTVMPALGKDKKPKARAIAAEEADQHTVRMLKAERNNARLVGYREVQRKAKAEKEAGQAQEVQVNLGSNALS